MYQTNAGQMSQPSQTCEHVITLSHAVIKHHHHPMLSPKILSHINTVQGPINPTWPDEFLHKDKPHCMLIKINQLETMTDILQEKSEVTMRVPLTA